MAETFLAFDNKAAGADCKLVTGISYDVAAEVDERNGWLDPGELAKEDVQAMIAIASRGLRELISFCFHGQVLDRRGKGMRTAMRRFIAVCWMLRSAELVDKDGRPLSLEKLSKLPQLHCTKCTLSLLAQEFGAQWGFRVRVQKKDTTKPNYARAAKTGWAKRRARERAES